MSQSQVRTGKTWDYHDGDNDCHWQPASVRIIVWCSSIGPRSVTAPTISIHPPTCQKQQRHNQLLNDLSIWIIHVKSSPRNPQMPSKFVGVLERPTGLKFCSEAMEWSTTQTGAISDVKRNHWRYSVRLIMCHYYHIHHHVSRRVRGTNNPKAIDLRWNW